MVKVSCFFAYASKPPALAETIETAISKLQGGRVVDILGWGTLRTTGKLVISEICEAIEKRDIFACDLTTRSRGKLLDRRYSI